MKAKFKIQLYSNGTFSKCVFTIDIESVREIPPDKLNPVNPLEMIVQGDDLPQVKGITCELDGKWINDKRYNNWVLDCFCCTPIVSRNRNSILCYLCSIKGIGSATASQIYTKFGLDSADILNEKPQRLLEVKCITQKKLDKIIQDVNLHAGYNKCYKTLSPYGLDDKQIKKIYKLLGENTISIIKKNPFELCKSSVENFLLADQISAALNVKQRSYTRISWAMLYCLHSEAQRKGHVCVETQQLISDTYAALKASISRPTLEEVRKQLLAEKSLRQQTINGTQYIYSNGLYKAEKETAIGLAKLIASGTSQYDQQEFEKALLQTEKDMNIILAASQKKAIEMAIKYPVSIITGGPGTGKTTILRCLKYLCQTLYKKQQIYMMAPTGRAARRMASSASFPNSGTIHHILCLMGDDGSSNPYVEKKVLSNAILFIDEFSMVDIGLISKIMDCIKENCKLVFIGDPDQLPSVGPGNVLKDMIASKQIPVVTLDTIYRQDASASDVVINAKRIRDGDTNMKLDTDFVFIEESDPAKVEKLIVENCLREAKEYSIDEVQVLSPYKKPIVAASTPKLNASLQRYINPSKNPKTEMTANGYVFRIGDKIIQQKNDVNNEFGCDIMNGDVGYVLDIGMYENVRTAKIDFGDNRIVYYTASDFEDNVVVLAYAITMHKSQGSEYKVVILPIIPEHNHMLQRNIVYTAVTRATTKVIIVGSMQTLEKAICKNNVNKRNSFLSQRIICYTPKAIAALSVGMQAHKNIS